MIFYFDSLGAPVSFTPERIFQGSNRANDIYLIAPAAPQCVASVKFSLPSGDSFGPEVMERCDELPDTIKNSEGADLAIWHYLLSSSVTAYPGAVSVQFTLTGTDGYVYATPAQEFIVERGVIGDEPVQGDSYQTVLDFVATLSGKVTEFEGKILSMSSTSIENGSGMGSVQQKAFNQDQDNFEGGNASGKMSASFGSETEASADFTFTAGKGTVAASECQFAVGSYNQEDGDAVFLVGNGTAEQKKTAFSVKKDGRATVGSAPQNDNDVVNKAYVDQTINNALDFASEDKAGIVKTNANYGIEALSDGMLRTVCATQEDIDAQTDNYKAITSSGLSYAVKAGLSNKKEDLTWTDEEKSSARNTIGALSGADTAILGSETPTISTPASFIGQKYIKNGISTYTCTNINSEKNEYTWKEEPISYATETVIGQQWQLNYWISPRYLAYAVKVALTAPDASSIPASWTDEEKAIARTTLGVTTYYLHTISAPENELVTRIISTEKEAFSITDNVGIICDPKKIVSVTVQTGKKAPSAAMWYSDSPDGTAIWQAKYYDMNGTELLNINFAVEYNDVGTDTVTVFE